MLLCATVACEPVKKTEIHNAVKAADVMKVKQLLAEAPGLVNEKDWLGDTPLHVAAQTDNIEMVGLLLDHKADINARADAGWTALHWAVYLCDKEMTALLLRHHADVNARISIGYAPLHWAACRNSKELVELLVAHKADVNAGDHNRRTPLHYAVYWNSKDAVEALLAHQADVNAKATADVNSDGNAITPLDIADRYGVFAIAGILRQHGAQREQMSFQHNKNNSQSPPTHKPSTSPLPRR